MILPSKSDRAIVVFWAFPSLGYETRLAIGLVLIAVGLGLQFATQTVLAGIIAMAAGNVLFLVKGYDNRVDARGFDPEQHWERVEMERLEELVVLDRKMRQWNRSLIDITNPLGVFAFLVVGIGLLAVVVLQSGPFRVLAIDALVLLVPHWLTGTRSILRRPGLLVRVKTIQQILDDARPELVDHETTLLMLLGGGPTPIPTDVKFKIDVAQHHPDFLGLYGQVVINEVQGQSYPYFYVVLVARRDFGLHQSFREFNPGEEITKEFKPQGEVEVFVIRQQTTKTSGYHTEPANAREILRWGLRIADRVAGGVIQGG